jgi:predicted nucleic acid-binding protein
MSLYVVDASVGIKWFIPEVHADAARRLRSPSYQLHVPVFFEIEVANIVWKKLRRGERRRDEVDGILTQLLVLPVMRHVSAPILASALDLAAAYDRSVYDCLYLALAVREQGQLVTADERFVNGMAGTPHASSVRWLPDVA